MNSIGNAGLSNFSSTVFRASDIRGHVPDHIDARFAHALGTALGMRAAEYGGRAIVVGKDARLGSVELAAALQAGIRATGVGVIDIGMATTPLVYFTTRLTETGAGVMVTGGHDADAYNGFKIMMGGEVLTGEELLDLRMRMEDLPPLASSGARTQIAAADCYASRVISDVRLERMMKVVVDCGYGAAAMLAPEVFRSIGCEVTELGCEVNGAFASPRGEPGDPNYLADLVAGLRYSDCEVGLALDGDGDRLAVVTRSGSIIGADRLLILFARDLLSHQPGAQVVYDVKSGRNLTQAVRVLGGRPVMWKSGHAHIRAKMRETDAPLAGEMGGQFYFKDRWYGYDDALYAGARLLEILSRYENPSNLLDSLPQACATPDLRLDTREVEQAWLIEALRVKGRFMGAREIIDLDGVRVEYDDGFGLARPASNGSAVVLRFEADTGIALSRIQEDFRRQLLSVAPHLRLPF